MNDSLKSVKDCKHKFLVSLFSVLSLTTGVDVASAQVTGDLTLSTLSVSENTQVTINNGVYEITGGAIQGSNNNLLFHSFDSFSLKDRQTAFFNHGMGVDIILSRVTGVTPSQIDGIITAGVDGVRGTSNADMFIINPRGIVFGPTATLEVGGSFIASTAEQIVFADGDEFSASNPQPVVLLTISQTIGLSLGESSRNIVNESRAGLEVLLGKSIMLIGNEIRFSGGGIIAPSGQIELASLESGSSVNLISPNGNDRSAWILEYGEDPTLSDIKLSASDDELSFIEGTDYGSSGRPNSHIRLRGRQITLDGSDIVAENYGTAQSGDIILSASGPLTLTNSYISAENYGTAQSGDIILSASGPLTLTDGSLVSVSTLSQGDGGNLDINVLGGTVKLLDDSRLLAESDEGGAAGNLTINAANLSVRQGSDISTSALGEGQGGNLVINTFGGSVEVGGAIPSTDLDESPNMSELLATTVGSQDAGGIQINTGTLLVEDSGQIRAETRAAGNGGPILINATESVVVTGQSSNSDTPSRIFSTTAALSGGNPLLTTGNAGPVKIVTNRLEVSEGATIFTTSSSSGRGGDLTVEANEVVLSGRSSSSTQRSGLYARARSAGDSGTVNLTANTLRIENGARLTVSNRDINERLTDNFPAQGFGTVRDANIRTQRIILNDGQITAESRSGNGGDLNFDVQDVIFLRNNSLISATAGTDASGGNGGNVTINIPDGFFIATPNENSDIIANAFSGTGGNIDITARNIIGADARQAIPDNGTNDIDASSEFGNSGTISLNNFELDPTEGLVELPASPAAPDQVAQRCLADSEGRSAFVITGQGGTAPNPGDVVRNEAIGWVDLGRTAPSVSRSERQASPVGSTTSPEPTSSEPLVEAQGWQQDSNGTVTLIAQLPSTQAVSRAQYSSCAHQSKR